MSLSYRSKFFLVSLASVFILAGCIAGPAPAPASPTQEQSAPAYPALTALSGPITAFPAESTPAAPQISPSETDLAPTATPTPLPTPIPSPPARSIFGVDFQPVTSRGGLELVADTRSAWLRGVGVSWADVEPSPGNRRWSALSAVESQWLNGINRDLTLIALVGQVPFWAQQFPGTACGPIDPDHLAEFGSFMHDLVSRYSQEPFNIKYWEIWNEPDIDWRAVSAASPFGCWGIREDPHFGGGAYGEMLKVIYPRIKAADPEAQVLVGGLLLDCDPRQPPEIPAGSGQIKDCTPARFLQGVLEAGGGDYFDGVSFHAYDFYFGEPGQYGNPNWHAAWDNSGPVLIQKARFLRELLNSYGYADKVLLNTEVALLCGSSGFEAVCQTRSMEETKASYVAQAYAAARAEGLLANVWYNLKGWRASGLATNGLQPLPAFTAYKFSAAMLDGAAYLGEVAEYPGVRGYRFQKDGSTFWIVWSRDGGTHTLTLPETPAAVFDVFGDPLPAAETLDVELAPIYITWSE